MTFSCYRRMPLLDTDHAKTTVQVALEQARSRYGFDVYGYVLMPEHVHLLLSEPESGSLATALNVLKTQTARQLKGDYAQFWQTRYYDANILTQRRWVNALRYLHRNPVKRELVTKPEDWPWSSYRHWLSGESGPVEMNSHWTWERREREGLSHPHSPTPPIAAR